MSLLRAERRRLFKRRFTRLMLAVVLLIMAVVVGAFVYTSHQIGPAERAAAKVEAEQMVREWTVRSEQDRAACEAARTSGDTSRFPKDMPCDSIRGPQIEDVPVKQFLPYEFVFAKEYKNLILVLSGLLVLFAFAVGASYVGAEWHTGGMMNLLLWRPRRVPVLLTKLGTLLGAVLAVSVLLGALWTLAFWLIGRYDGVTGTMTPGVWRSLALDGARGVGLALAFGVVGFCLASLGRHTAMAMGVAVGAVVVGEIGVRIALGLISSIEFPARFQLSTYAVAWLQKELKLEEFRSCDWAMNECKPKQLLITWDESALIFGTGTALVLILAFWVMRRRDVT